MADRTAIEWADATWNPIVGTRGRWSCVKISEGCKHCYAERLNMRFHGPPYAAGRDRLRLDERMLTQPLRWRRPRRIFVCSMTDLLEERVEDDWIEQIFAVMVAASQHTFLVLTKRAERMARFCQNHQQLTPGVDGALAAPMNIWVGISAETQERLEERIPHLLRTPAAVRFLSLEPLLGRLNVLPYLRSWGSQLGVHGETEETKGLPLIDWVIVGGESGGPRERALVERAPAWDCACGWTGCGAAMASNSSGIRVCPNCRASGWPWQPKREALAWVRTIRDQCVAAGVLFFFKGWGGRTFRSGGRLLDGREWNEYPGGCRAQR